MTKILGRQIKSTQSKNSSIYRYCETLKRKKRMHDFVILRHLGDFDTKAYYLENWQETLSV